MKPIFPKGVDDLKPVIFLTGAISTIGIILIVNFYFTDAHLSVGYKPDQPIPFSHRLHAGEMGIDCRYCHVSVEKSPHASVPASQICMNCHSQVKTNSPLLKPLRDRYAKFIEEETVVVSTGGTQKRTKVKKQNTAYKDPIPWVRIHNLPDYSYFNHSVHVNANISCVECHGRVDQMIVAKQVKPLSMSWCLDCHWNYEDYIRPEHVSITDMAWTWDKEKSVDEAQFKQDLVSSKKFNPPQECSACHH